MTRSYLMRRDRDRACSFRPEPESFALDQLRWVISRFSAADAPGWTPPGEDELRQHFDDRFLAVIPAGTLVEQASKMAADLRAELVVISATPLEAHIQLADLRYIAVADATPPHRLIGLRGFPLGGRITDPRVKAPPPSRTHGEPPGEIAGLAADACAELGLPALVLAGGQPGRAPWVVATGLADLDRAEPLETSHRFPVPGVTALVTATAVLRLVAEGRLGLVVAGLDAAAIGDLAAGHGIALHALVPRQASLEDAYLDLTGESVEYSGEGTTPG